MSDVGGVSRNNGSGAASPQTVTPFEMPVAAGGDVKIAQRLPEAVVRNESNAPVYAIFSAVNGKGNVVAVPPDGVISGADAIAFDDDRNGPDKKDRGFRFTDGSQVRVFDTPFGQGAHHTDAGGYGLTVAAQAIKGGYGMKTVGQIEKGLGGYPLFFNGRQIK